MKSLQRPTRLSAVSVDFENGSCRAHWTWYKLSIVYCDHLVRRSASAMTDGVRPTNTASSEMVLRIGTSPFNHDTFKDATSPSPRVCALAAVRGSLNLIHPWGKPVRV